MLARRAAFLAAMTLVSSSTVVAGVPTEGNTTVGQIDELRAQIAVLEQELTIAKLKQGIKAAESGPAPSGPAGRDGLRALNLPEVRLPGPKPEESTSSAANSVSSDDRQVLPRIVSIDGRGARLSAVLLMPDGGNLVATPGLGLGDGLTVHDVSPSGVRVMRAGSLIPLSFADTEDPTPEPRTNQSSAIEQAPFRAFTPLRPSLGAR